MVETVCVPKSCSVSAQSHGSLFPSMTLRPWSERQIRLVWLTPISCSLIHHSLVANQADTKLNYANIKSQGFFGQILSFCFTLDILFLLINLISWIKLFWKIFNVRSLIWTFQVYLSDVQVNQNPLYFIWISNVSAKLYKIRTWFIPVFSPISSHLLIHSQAKSAFERLKESII